jgi:hypothetical protein
MKPLPPYARSARVVEGCLWVRCGKLGWEYARKYPERGEIVFPGDDPANAYSWDFVNGLGVYVVAHDDTPYPRVAGLCTALLIAGAREVTAIDPRFLETHPNCDWSGWMTFRLDEMRNVG